MSIRDITFLRINYLRGPNIWTYRPVIEAWVDIGAFEQLPTNKLPGFTDRLIALLPGLHEHRCGVGEPGGFILRLRDGTWLGHVMEHVAIELQNLAGSKVGFGKARQTTEGSGIYKVAVRTRDERLGRTAITAAREVVLAMANDTEFDLAATLAVLRDIVDRNCLGPSTACIVEAAADRRIPSIRLNDGNLVQLGYGREQRRIWTAETDRTSAIAEGISRDKDLTKSLLSSCGVPIPEGRIVSNAADAWEAAEDIGLPVVVKPVDGNHGRGVSLELMSKEEVEAAFVLADQEGSDVIVERFIRGDEHRLLMVGGKLVAAGRGEHLYIIADGKSTVRQLIDDQINSDPRRGAEEEFPLDVITLEREDATTLLLQRQGLAADSVPKAGKRILIQRNGNVAFDCTDEVCAEVAETAALAARIVGLDIAGIDVVAEDISKPFEAQGGAIVEVNAGPSLLMHLKPATGKPRPAGEAIVNHLFSATDSGRVPVVGVTGERGATQISHLIAWILHLAGRHVGLACGEGKFLDRRQVSARNAVNFDEGQSLLMNRTVQAVVIQSNARGILSDGLPYDRCDVGVVTNVAGGEALDEFYITNDDQAYNVVRSQVDVVLPEGAAVLNATDTLAVSMAELSDGDVILYAEDGNLPAIAKHRAAGRRAVFAQDGLVILAEGMNQTALRRSNELASGDTPTLENALAAAAAAWALHVTPELIGAGIETYRESVAGASVAPAGASH
jgi:cyanophycin synthetase